MARGMWTGVISFGLVTIPVKLHAATTSHGISFRQIHDKCKQRIRELRWCPHCDREVAWEEVDKGYEYAKNEFIQLSDEDFDDLPLPSKNTIDVGQFVPLQDIDPIYFDSCYYAEADKGGQKPYDLLLQVMQSKEMAGIATITLRNKERLCAVRASNDVIMIQTLLYNDEIKVEKPAHSSSKPISAQERKMAETLVDALASDFEPEKYKDKYQEALEELIDAKLKGLDIISPSEQAGGKQALDLMEALRASVAGTKPHPSGRQKKPRSTPTSANGRKKRAPGKAATKRKSKRNAA